MVPLPRSYLPPHSSHNKRRFPQLCHNKVRHFIAISTTLIVWTMFFVYVEGYLYYYDRRASADDPSFVLHVGRFPVTRSVESSIRLPVDRFGASLQQQPTNPTDPSAVRRQQESRREYHRPWDFWSSWACLLSFIDSLLQRIHHLFQCSTSERNEIDKQDPHAVLDLFLDNSQGFQKIFSADVQGRCRLFITEITWNEGGQCPRGR